ncbi:MAG: DEAD/DEAH box helicase [Myxococcota bacterium]|nr:DEAD/DEAH box helicase [Myxococcota bacterium]
MQPAAPHTAAPHTAAPHTAAPHTAAPHTAAPIVSRTYGTARLINGEWHVEAEPHVAIRLRRHFARAGAQFGVIKLRATDEVCRDLKWFCERFPLEVDPADTLLERARSFDRRTEAFAAVLAGHATPRDFELALPPREYQRVAAELALQSGGLLIGDEVGLGKTVSAIAALSPASSRPALVVTLTHLPRQWAAELARFLPGARVHVLKKGSVYDITKPPRRTKKGAHAISRPVDPAVVAWARARGINLDDRTARFPDVIVTSYSKLHGWADELHGKVNTVVFDEVQELRHSDTIRYAAAKRIAEGAAIRLGLSATPVYNFGVEMHSILEVLRPGALGSRGEFLEEWCRGYHDPAKAAVADPLPALEKSIVRVDADTAALEAVSASVAELARFVLERAGAWQERGQASRELDWRLRQATGIAKAPYVAEYVKLLCESGERVVVYAWHREVYEILRDKLREYRPVLYTGTESTPQKEAAKQAFVSGESRVLLMSLRAGAGLDGLQHVSRTVVFAELDWSPGIHEQAIGRVHRDGQPDPVIAYFLVSDEGSDPIVLDVLQMKKPQMEGVRDPDREIFETVKVDSIRTLARAYLEQRGLPVPEPKTDLEDAAAAEDEPDELALEAP